jgi:hypothetical protein
MDPQDLKEFFLGYPIIKIHMKNIDGENFTFDWFPSEYLYLDW